MPFYLYILFSLSVDKYYNGSSKTLIRRLHFYNTIEKDSLLDIDRGGLFSFPNSRAKKWHRLQNEKSNRGRVVNDRQTISGRDQVDLMWLLS